MKVTFIDHSGFAVELAHTILIFDYSQGEIPEYQEDKKIFVFVSHNHEDHYNQKIWKLKEKYPEVVYILSDDIHTTKEAVFMAPYETRDLGEVRIETFKSNDLGVAFLVKAEGKTIYHAGDLNWWHWNGEPEKDNLYYKKTFQQEMERLKGRQVDFAFMLLDPRQEDKYCWGMNYFLEKVHPKCVFPMHCFGAYQINRHYLRCRDGKKWAGIVQNITKPGEEFILE